MGGSSRSPAEPGQRVSHYEIVEELGRGGMGVVYRARDLTLGRSVALKCPLPGRNYHDTQQRRRLLREARAASRLAHPHIVPIYEVLEHEGVLWLAMEFVEGTTLRGLLARGRPLAMADVLRHSEALTGALDAAHARGVLHRDINPNNVMVRSDGRAVVTDFGLARRLSIGEASSTHSHDEELDAEGKVVGTLRYMSPEQALGKPLDGRSDLFSLGAVMYEMCAGQPAFGGTGPAAIDALLNRAPPPLSRLNPEVSAELERIVAKCLAKDPDDRYQGARDLAVDLRAERRRLEHAAGGEDRASPEPPGPGVESRERSRSARRWRSGRAAAVLAVLAAAIALGPQLWQTGSPLAEATSSPVVAVLPLAGAADAEAESLAAGTADTLISSLSKVSGLAVVSRQATLPYRERKKDTETIARELGATMLVDGGVQRAGDRVRLTLSLLRPGSKVVLWTGMYDGNLREVFALQSEVAEAVAETMRVRLSPQDRREVQKAPTGNVEAFADYAQARSFFDRPDVKGNLDRAIALFKSAVARDPRFARAHAALGEAYWRRFKEGSDPTAAMAARDAAAEALRLDPADASVRYTLAKIYRDTGRLDASVEELRHAIRLQPSFDEAHGLLGQILAQRGDTEAGIRSIHRAIELRPNYWGHHFDLGSLLYGAGRFREAIQPFRRVTELQPDSAWGYQALGTTYHAVDDTRNAVVNYRRAIDLGNAKAYSNLGIIHFDEKRFADAARAFEEAIRLEPNSPIKRWNLAESYVELGDRAGAVREYRRMMDLGRKGLEMNPKDGVSLSIVAVAEAKLGETGPALRDATRAVSLSPANGDVLFREALVLALAGRDAESVAVLEKALSRGYSLSRVRKDDDLSKVRRRPEFEEMVARVQSRASTGGGD